MTCAHDSRYLITTVYSIDYSKIFKSQKDDYMLRLNIYTVSETTRQVGLVRCSQYGLSTSPYESKLASG